MRAGAIRITANRTLLGCVGVAALLSLISLLFSHAIDYDAEGWIVYAREAFGPQVLNTSGFPAWKPLPVILIGPFTLLTRGEGDVYYWLFITRTAAILTVFGAAALGHRFGGRMAALLAAVFVMLAPYWAVDGAIGRDSAVSGALMMGAFLAHYRGWYRITVLELTGVALLRPEITPLLLIYGIYLAYRRRLAWWFTLGAIALIALMWLIPTILHTGLSPAAISLNSGGPNAAVNTPFPFWTVIKEAAQQAHQVPAILIVVAALAGVYGLLRRALHRAPDRFSRLWGRDLDELVMLGTGAAWVFGIALETEIGFAGNPRYLVPGLLPLIVTGAVLAARVAGSSRALQLTLSVLCIGVAAVLAAHPLKSGLQLVQLRDKQVDDIRQELAVLRCPHGYLANNENNAYLSQVIGAPLQTTVDWKLPSVRFDGGKYYWFVYCKPQ